MVTIKNEKLVKAVNGFDGSKTKLAVHSDVSEPTLKKVLDGDTDVNLSSIGKLATFLGFDVVVSFKPQDAAEEVSA